MIISQQFINKIWYEDHHLLWPLSWALVLLGWLYCFIAAARHFLYKFGPLTVYRLDVPVIVVGNFTAGGTGKTPLVIWLAEYLKTGGYKPGIVSRGYRASSDKRVQRVETDSDPAVVGDEPVLIARRSQCPVAIGCRRDIAAKELIDRSGCDVIIADDGLQHYRLHRDIQINVIDGRRRFGNRRCLPAGPLRESLARLKEMDITVVNGRADRQEHRMDYRLQALVNLNKPGKRAPLHSFAQRPVHAVAGIGDPERFFSCLRQHRLQIIEHIFPDHHYYSSKEIHFDDDLPVLMTEKDAVKCDGICSDRHWYLPVDAEVSESFLRHLNILINNISNGQEAA